MAPNRTLNISISPELERRLREKVASGAYADESEFISESIRNQLDRDEEIESWLRNQVVPSIGKIERRESSLHTLDQAFDGLEERYLARAAKAGN